MRGWWNIMTLLSPEILRRLDSIEQDMNDSKIPYAVTTNNGNVYSGTFGLTSLTDGRTIRLKCNANSNGAISVNPDGLGAVAVLTASGSQVSDWKLNGIYTLTYNSSTGTFILQGEGRDKAFEAGLQRQIADLTSLADIYDRVSGAQSVFYDRMDWTNDHSCGQIDFFYTTTVFAYNSGAYTIKVRDVEGLGVGQSLTIFDRSNNESKIIESIDSENKQLTFTTALSYNYLINAAVCRTSMVIGSGTNVLTSTGWRYDVSIDGRPGLRNLTVFDSDDDMRWYGGRRCVVLDNGWLFSVLGNYTLTYQLSKDCGYTWQTVFSYDYGCELSSSICGYGSIVYIFQARSNNNTYVHIFDTVTNQGTYVNVPNGATTMSPGCDIAVDQSNGNLYVTWVAKTSLASVNVFHSMSVDGGQTWTRASGSGDWKDYITNSDDATIEHIKPSITILNNKPIIAWTTYNSTSGIYSVSRGRWDGAAWSNMDIYTNTYSQENVVIMTTLNGCLHAIWDGCGESSTTHTNIMYSRSTNNGLTWSIATNITNQSTVDHSCPTITFDKDNKIYAIWHTGSLSGAYNLYSASAIDGVWSQPVAITNKTSGEQSYPSAVLYPYFNEPLFIWTDTINKRILFSGVADSWLQDNNTLPATVANSTFDISGSGRKIVKLSIGWLVSVYIDAEKPTFNISKDNGYSWHPLTVINHTYNNGRRISIDVYGTNIYCICSTSDVAICVIGFDVTNVPTSISYSTHGVTTLQTISSADFDSSYIIIDQTNGNIHTAWTAKSALHPNSLNLRYSKGINIGSDTEEWVDADGDVGFQTISLYNEIGYDVKDPIIILKNSQPRIIVSYAGSNNTESRSLIYYQYNNPGWSSANIVGPGIYEQSNPSAIADASGNLYLTWIGKNATYTTKQLWFSKLLSDSSSWSTPICPINSKNHVTSVHDVANPSIAVDAMNRLLIAYQAAPSFNENYDQIVYQISYDGGNAWSPMIKVTSYKGAAQLNPCTLNNTDFIATKPTIYWNDTYDSKIQLISNGYDVYKKSNTIVTPTSQHLATNCGRKITRLDNGWLVVATFDGVEVVSFYISKDDGISWSRLCYMDGCHGDYALYSYINKIIFIRADYGMMYFYEKDVLTISDINIRDAFTSIIDSQISIRHPSVVCDRITGRIYVAWCSKNDAYQNSYILRFRMSDDGITWTSIVQLEGSASYGYNCEYPTIVLNDGIPLVIFSRNGANANYGVSCYRINNSVWGWDNVSIYDSGASLYPQIKLNAAVSPVDGSIHVVWAGADAVDTTTNIWYAKSIDNGLTWTTPIKISPSSASGYDNPSVSINSDNIIFVLFNTQETLKSICLCTYTTSWSAMQILTDSDISADNPHACANFYNFSKPLFVYEELTNLVIKFSGEFKVYNDTSRDIVRLNIQPALGQTDGLVSWCKFESLGFNVDAVCSIVPNGSNETFNTMVLTIAELSTYVNELQGIYNSNIYGQRVNLAIRVYHYSHGYINMLGVYGECNDDRILNRFLTNCIIQTNSLNTVNGNNSLDVILTSTSFNICIQLLHRIDPTKYYMISAYLKNGNIPEGVHIGFATLNATEPIDISSEDVTDSNNFTRVILRIKPSNLAGASTIKLFAISGYGESNQHAYVSSIMLNEISEDEYNYDSDLQLMQHYQYAKSSRRFGNISYIGGAVN